MGKAACVAYILIATIPASGRAAVRLEEVRAPVPHQFAPAVERQLSPAAARLADAGTPWFTLWPATILPPSRDTVPSSSRVFARLPPGALIGALRLERAWRDYRDQEVPPGAYTLRYAVQPLLKDHAGVSPYRDFLLLVHASDDDGQARGDAAWVELSRKVARTGHPAVVALMPIKVSSPSRLIEDVDGRLLLILACLNRDFALVVEGHGALQPL